MTSYEVILANKKCTVKAENLGSTFEICSLSASKEFAYSNCPFLKS